MAQFSLELCFRVAFLAVLLPLASGACVDLDLGMGKATIPNSNITASSIQSASTPAKNGRLNYTSGSSWCARTSDTNPYLQIDLQTLHIICAVSTQGNSQADQWVKNYTLQFSINGTTWTDHKEDEQVKFLRGNDDRNSEVKHVVYGVLTRYLRFLPQTHQGGVCMRTEVFGVEQKLKCSMQAIGVARKATIPDSSFSAQTEFSPDYAAKYGRLNNNWSWAPKGNANADDYLQIDLLFEYVICAVATQGNKRASEWTTKYKIRLSLKDTNFVTYKENNADKVFPGNSNQNGIVKNSLHKFASAKFIRFQPTAFDRYKSLRVEVYGVLLTKVPSQPPTDFKLTASSSTSIMTSWQLPPALARHGRNITGFILFYKKKSSGVPATKLNITDGSTLSRNVTGLEEYTEYEFQVLAYTSDGNGPKSPVEVERTKEAAPSRAPSSFNVTAVTSTIITASWHLPPGDSRNGVIKGFKLFYKKRGSTGSETILPINNGTAFTKDVIGLDNNTQYEFEVLAFTSVGDGPKSPVVVVKTMKYGCDEFNLGMEDGTIPSNRVTASSEQNASTPAKNGRLNYTSGSSWCAGTSDTNPYLQIDLQTLHIICAVSTQGNSQADHWVTTYRLQLSTDGTTWKGYKEGGQIKALRGNNNRYSEVKHVVYGVLTRYLRFLPQTHQGGVCMRTEVFGVKQKPMCNMEAIGLASGGAIPNSSFTATSFYDGRYKSYYGRLNADELGWAPKTKTNPADFLQIDLLYEHFICVVATQGSSGSNEWTTEYKIHLSLDGTTFFVYKENSTDKLFPGNSNKKGIVKNSLQGFARAKIIRFQPTRYDGWPVLRVEVYGILLTTTVPSQPPTDFKLTASSSTSITVSWKLPPLFARHGRNITGFKLFHKKKGSTGSAFSFTINNGSVLTRLVTKLDKYTEYEFQVLAFTSDSDGAKSPVEVERTKEDAPSQAPSSLTVSAVTSSAIRASWQLPPLASRNGVIKGFKLFFKEKASAGLTTTLHINSGLTLSRIVTGLKKYTEYEFQVLAFTSVGNGPKSPVEVERTKEDVPSKAPSSFTVTAVTSTTVTATWQSPTEDSRNGVIKGFKLFYKKNGFGGSATNLTFNNGTALGKDVTGLDNNTEYEFQVLAFTSVGDGPKSSVEVVRTMKDGGCIEFYLGMENGRVPDDKITATTELSANTPAKNGRLNYSSGSSWCARTSDANPYLQIDLQTLHVICAVSTQGNSQADQWVRNYTLQLSTDGTTWTDYKEGGLVKVFKGNDDRNSNVKEIVYGVLTRYLRFLPQTHQGGVCMRTEVFGVKQKPTCNVEAIGLASGGTIPDSSFTATSFYDDRYKPFRGRLNANTRGWGPKQKDDPKDYLQVDLLYEHFICAMATQGSKGSNEWTTEYKIHFSLDGAKFFAYSETNVEKLFSGNSNRNGIVKNSLQEFVSAKFIRFQPTKKRQWKVLRVEVYGILLTKVPSKPPTAFTLTASSSTSITASWQLPPVFARHGKIAGFKLFYRKKGSGDAAKTSVIQNGTRFSRDVSGLERYTEYEFQVLAFTSFGDGPNSTVKAERTMEDAPSQPPSHLSVTVNSSTCVTASWQPPPEESRHGIIRGFKLFYQKKDSGSAIFLTISRGKTSTRVTKLSKYTEYEFQVLAFTSAGDGPNSSAVFRTTMEDAPSKPTSLSFVNVPPSNLHGPRVNLSWSKPTKPNGVIKSYTLFYSHGGGAPIKISGIYKDTLSHTVDVLGGVTYQFHVRAVTIKPGPNETITVPTEEYAPSVGPEPASPSPVNKTTFNISWEPLSRNKSFGKVTLYEVKAIFLEKGNLRKRSVINSPSANTSATFVVLSDLELCSKYNVSVRAYTRAGPGPYGKPVKLETSTPEAPGEFRATDFGTTQVTLTWKQYDEKENIKYIVKYDGTKDYNKTFKAGEKIIERIERTTKTVKGLIPGTKYVFRVRGISSCGESSSKSISVRTDVTAPDAPLPHNVSDVKVSETAVDIFLWPVEQKYGPISAYQVIVLKVTDGDKKLPEEYDSKLKAASDAKRENVNFYIAAEIENAPLLDKPRKFTVGDGEITEEYVNEKLEKGENYIVYERALTKTETEELKGKASIVARISISLTTTEGGKKGKSSGSNAAVVAVPVVLLLLLIPAIVVAVFFYRRRRQSRSKSATERSVQLDDLKSGSQDLTSSTSNLVYQNVGDIRRTTKGAKQQPVSEETEAIYSEADDGKPKPIPVAEFAKYFKQKSENGAIVLREEFKYLPGGMQFSWEIGKSNRGKNRYGNIVSYDHSRVLLEEIEGDKNSSYINASYIPTYDEVTMTYIATQGPTSSTIADFWRMVWQENSSTIVMLTNLVELGKGKCDQYWPDDATKFGAITVTLHKTETFADYVIRSLIVTKDAEKRNVQQFHYITWPDKGVPHHSTALLGFRQKIHARHLATGGPLLVHCSAGVGRTGTYIAIDAMLESAEKIKTVFIQNYVQVMRKSRPHMIQKDDQYVFLHQAVMEALVCGNTEIVPQDLRIAMNKLAMVHKPSKKTGYEQEFKRLERVTDAEASQEEAKQAFMPANVVKNRFPNVVPLDSARVLLQASSQDKSYINASYVDDYKQRNAYILTQAPLDNTILDLWQMISQYDIGTVVMLNNLKEGKQNYPQYWPSKESAEYGDVTVQLLSQETSNNITTRRFSLKNAALPKKKSTLQHIQYTGWANTNSCPDPQEILDLMTAVQQSQQQSGNGVIVFQCSDGIGRSGCVATIMSVIERVKIEQTVDVFQTVKLVRAKRPGAVNTLEQYIFCYQTVVAYLDSFSTYSNFAEC